MTDRETIESMLYELATPQNMGSFFVKNATSDFLLIRPSGNPITAKGFEEMMSSGDVVQEKAEITSSKLDVKKNDYQRLWFPRRRLFYERQTRNI